MNGMHCEQHWAYNPNDDWYSASWHFELPSSNTIVQLSLGSYDEQDDKGLADLAITHVEFLDTRGNPQQRDFPIAVNFPARQVMSVNRLTRVDWQAIVSNAFARIIVNLFFWDQVS